MRFVSYPSERITSFPKQLIDCRSGSRYSRTASAGFFPGTRRPHHWDKQSYPHGAGLQFGIAIITRIPSRQKFGARYVQIALCGCIKNPRGLVGTDSLRTLCWRCDCLLYWFRQHCHKVLSLIGTRPSALGMYNLRVNYWTHHYPTSFGIFQRKIFRPLHHRLAKSVIALGISSVLNLADRSRSEGKNEGKPIRRIWLHQRNHRIKKIIDNK